MNRHENEPVVSHFFQHMTPRHFEVVVEGVLRRIGMGLPEFSVQRLEKIQAADGVYEIDVTARFEVLGASFLVLIECKHHRHPIKREVVQILYDRVRAIGAQKGMLFSTAPFQKGAIDFARVHRIALIQMVDEPLPLNFHTVECALNRTIEHELSNENERAYLADELIGLWMQERD